MPLRHHRIANSVRQVFVVNHTNASTTEVLQSSATETNKTRLVNEQLELVVGHKAIRLGKNYDGKSN